MELESEMTRKKGVCVNTEFESVQPVRSIRVSVAYFKHETMKELIITLLQ